MRKIFKSKYFSLLFSIALLPFLVLFLMFIDGFTIFTLSWEKINGTIIESKTIEYTSESGRYGSRSRNISNVIIKYIIDEKEYYKEYVLDGIANPGQKIDIKVNSDNTKITTKELNYQFFLGISVILVLYVLMVIHDYKE